LANLGIKRINDIIKSTLRVIEQSRGAIFEIAENARKEVANLKVELQKFKYDVQVIMQECEMLEVKVAKSRMKLAAINKDFQRYAEEEMRAAYQETNDLMVQLAVAREREKQTIIRRNDVEQRLKNALETVAKAEKLVAQVGTVFSYLSGDLQKLDVHLEDAESKRLLAIRIIKAQEDERRRIARDMHDGPAQAMSNVVLKAEICERMATVDIDMAIAELKELKEVVRSCLKEVRRIIYDLRPMSIDDLGLVPTLTKYIESFKQQNNLRVELRIRGDEPQIKDSNIILTVFRVVQESLNNIRKHAEATSVSLQLEAIDGNLTMRIKDDGIGFDPSQLFDTAIDGSGFGILGMKERVELMEGSFHIDSSIGSGTTVRVQLPYELRGGNV
jgi:two-component system sensor histidine kinase DegS